jgi:predicted ATPase
MPWTVLGMSEADRAEWIEHVQTAIPDIIGIRPVIRGEDRHCYLMIQYQNLGEIPQWMVSEGTLRLLALTLPAFLSQPSGILLVEEPENGLHPKALETVFQALSYISDTQVLMSTHSPQLLVLAEPHQILCFAKDSSGAVDIVRGDQHPTLKDWQRDISLGTLFAAGALE